MNLPPDIDIGGAAVPGKEPNIRRTIGTSDKAERERPYVKVPIGWSNLQLGPNLQMP